jgi:uncharacterized protein (PEP-CTERM system associated)
LRRRFLPATTATPDDHAPGWQYNLGIDVSEEYTDNALGTGQLNTITGTVNGSQRVSDFITAVTPSLNISADTARIKGTLNYSPTVYVYAQNGSQDQVAQNFSGQVTATLVPDALFLDLRGYAALQTLSGGVSTVGGNTTNRANEVQSTSFSASPYFQHQFAGTGTLVAGVSVSHTSQTGVTGLAANQTTLTAETIGANGAPVLTIIPSNTNQQIQNGDVTTTEEHASFTTGEDFGRINQRVSVSATQYDGAGEYQGAHRDYAAYDVGYAVNRLLTVIGRAGHEDIFYGGITPYKLSDIVWNVGVRLTAGDRGSVTITYGRQDGADSIEFNGSYNITPRIRLFGSYSEGVETDQEDLQNTLAGADVGTGGGLFDSQTGAPITLGSGFYGLQNTVNRVRRLSFSAVYLLERDTITAALSQQRTSALTAAGTAGVANSAVNGTNSGTFGTLSWAHDLSGATQTSLFVQYGTYGGTGTTNTTQTVASVSAQVSYALSPTLSTRAQYTYTRNSSNQQGGSYDENIVLVGVHKSF